MSETGPVLVTGASGFIGSHVVRRLSLNPDCAVIPATRDGREGSRQLNLLEPAGFTAALSGVRSVVHCAVGDRQVTVAGTAALLAAAAAAGVQRFVHLSSVAVYGGATGAVAEATAMVDPAGQSYSGWKAAAEQACLSQTTMEVVRLRPAIVYGPGAELWVTQLARRIRSDRWGVFGPAGDGFCNLVHVADVAAAVERALTAPGIGGSAFNISGTEVLTWNEWFQRFSDAIGGPQLSSISPGRLKARVLASLPVKAASRLSPGLAADWLLGCPARSELALFALRASYPVNAAWDGFGWAPETGVEEGLAGCAAWLRERDSGQRPRP